MPSYDELHELYRDGHPCPPDFSFPTHVIDEWAKTDSELCAIHWVSADFSVERKVSYRQLADLSNRAAIVFGRQGIAKGDRVMVQLPRVCEWWITIFGLLRVGAVPIPGTSLLVAKDLKFRAVSAGAKAFVGDFSAAERFEEIAAAVGISTIFQVRLPEDYGLGKGRIDFQAAIEAVPEGSLWKGEAISSSDLSMLYFTSGTTGMPKQVLLENEYLLGHRISGHWYRLEPGKLFANMADLGWAKAAYSTFGAFNLGATLFVQPPPPGAFNPLAMIDMLHRYPITTLCCPPTIYRSLVTTAASAYFRANPPQALEHCVGAGEPLNPSVIRDFRELSGVTVCDGWGQTETVIVVGNFQGERVKEGSMGKVAPGFEVGVIGPNGEELADGEEGELCVRADVGGGANWIFKGYVKDGKVDKRQKSLNGKTWYTTGDRGTRDADGHFWFVGRDDDVISSAGYRIGPFEVESALKEHPAVLESAAVASPDAQRGEIVKAFIILSAEYEEIMRGKGQKEVDDLILEIQDFVRKNASPYKYPRAIEFVDTLPKTVSGKIRRIELRDLEYARKAHIVTALKAKL